MTEGELGGVGREELASSWVALGSAQHPPLQADMALVRHFACFCFLAALRDTWDRSHQSLCLCCVTLQRLLFVSLRWESKVLTSPGPAVLQPP